MSGSPSHGRVQPAAGRLLGKVALVAGSGGIARAVALCFAGEGADVAVVHPVLAEEAARTGQLIEGAGRASVVLGGDLSVAATSQACADAVAARFGRIDILANVPGDAPASDPQRFQTDIVAQLQMAKAALAHMRARSCVINTVAPSAYAGHATLADFAATQGAIAAFTRSLAQAMAGRQIRVNAVAPGAAWPSGGHLGKPASVPAKGLQRAPGGPPDGGAERRRTGEEAPASPDRLAEVAACYLLLATADGGSMTGQVLQAGTRPAMRG